MSLWPSFLPALSTQKRSPARVLNEAACLISLLQNAMTRGRAKNPKLAKEGFNHFATFLGSGHVPTTGLGSRRHLTRTLLHLRTNGQLSPSPQHGNQLDCRARTRKCGARTALELASWDRGWAWRRVGREQASLPTPDPVLPSASLRVRAPPGRGSRAWPPPCLSRSPSRVGAAVCSLWGGLVGGPLEGWGWGAGGWALTESARPARGGASLSLTAGAGLAVRGGASGEGRG